MHSAMGCCAPAHDQTIGEAMGFLVPEVCQDDDGPRPPGFDSLEEWYCLGCDPEADNYIDWYNTDHSAYELPVGTLQSSLTKDTAVLTEANKAQMSSQYT